MVKDDEKALWALVEMGEWPREAGMDLGIHWKRTRYLCHKWSRQGKYDYGVTYDLGWPVKQDG